MEEPTCSVFKPVPFLKQHSRAQRAPRSSSKSPSPISRSQSTLPPLTISNHSALVQFVIYPESPAPKEQVHASRILKCRWLGKRIFFVLFFSLPLPPESSLATSFPIFSEGKAAEDMGLFRNLGLCFSHLPRLLVEEDATSPAAAVSADSVASMAPSPFPSPPSPRSSSAVPFRPSIAVIVGVLTTMFSLTFLLLLYAKHCKQTSAGLGGGGSGASGFPAATERRNSGVERTVVESLPVFRFGSLRGQKEGLECAVCLNRFEPAEALRLLPKCHHAFHVECVDTWLDAHSTCPLCRVRVEPEDVLLVPDPRPRPDPNPPSSGGGGKPPRDSKTTGDETATNPTPYGRRISGRHSSAGEKCSNSLQIVVHRTDPANRRSADCAAALGGAAAGGFEAARGKVRKDGLLLPADREEFERRYSHRIVVSGGDGMQERWSDLRPSDLLFLRSEMIITDSGRFSASRAGRASGSSTGGGRGVISARCASEITWLRRLPIRAHSSGGGSARREEGEERTMRRWLGFAAKRKARWLGSREGANEFNT